MSVESLSTDVLVIGSGIAGLWAAIEAHRNGVEDVTIVDKASIGMSGQSRMAAGATIYCLPKDDLAACVGDFVQAHGGLCRRDFVVDLLSTSHRRLRLLESWGVTYACTGSGDDGYLRLPARGLPHNRMLVRPRHGRHFGGKAVVTALRREVARARVRRIPRFMVTELLAIDRTATGVMGVDRTTGRPTHIAAPAIVLASGDCSFRGNYVGVDAATGDALHMGYEAGARLVNCEFLSVNTGSPYFGFEGTGVALRLGGKLVDAAGNPFMSRHHPEGDAAEIHHVVGA
ncbi:MAG: FAD-dependent oxidoreductase, partial [Actinobacteria bacterium ATB1]|nr:FAD-dependent oxidoreductase [Actinobacteria bacterium ATB1]